jgi:hypothetical protein
MRYGKITSRFWTGETGRALRCESPWIRLVATYLVTCPWKTMLGLYYLPLPLLVHEVGCKPEVAAAALRRLGELGFAHYDHRRELVWVVNMAREQVGPHLERGDKRVVHVRKLIEPYLDTPLGRAWLVRYARAYRCPDFLEEATAEQLERELAQTHGGHGPGNGRGRGLLEGDEVDEDEQLERELAQTHGGHGPGNGRGRARDAGAGDEDLD